MISIEFSRLESLDIEIIERPDVDGSIVLHARAPGLGGLWEGKNLFVSHRIDLVHDVYPTSLAESFGPDSRTHEVVCEIISALKFALVPLGVNPNISALSSSANNLI